MRATNEKIMDDGPQEIEALLPWYAAGTLGPRDASRVEEALKRDPALQRQYAAIQEEYIETVALNESLGAPSPGALHKLMAAIDAEPVRQSSAAPIRKPGWFGAFLASLSPRTLAWSASFGALALVLQAGIIGTILLRSGLDTFQSPELRDRGIQAERGSGPVPAPRDNADENAARGRAAAPAQPAPQRRNEDASPAAPSASDQSSASSESPPAIQPEASAPSRGAMRRSLAPGGGIQVKEVAAAVTFQPEARMSDIAALLGSYHATVIGGEGSTLRLRFEGMTTPSDLAIILTALRKERIVATAVASP